MNVREKFCSPLLETQQNTSNDGATGPWPLGAENRAGEVCFRGEENEPEKADLPKVTQSGGGGSLTQFWLQRCILLFPGITALSSESPRVGRSGVTAWAGPGPAYMAGCWSGTQSCSAQGRPPPLVPL